MKSIASTREGALLRVRVIPRASANALCGEMEGVLKVRLQAPPVEGKANKALCRFIARKLGVPGKSVEIVSGETSRVKSLLLRGLSAATAKKKLNPCS